MGNGNTDVGKKTAPRSSAQAQMTSAMSEQGYVMDDNECTPQKLVRLVGYRDPKARLNAIRADRQRQFGEIKS